MKRVKQRIFAGSTCDQIVMHVRDGEVGSRTLNRVNVSIQKKSGKILITAVA